MRWLPLLALVLACANDPTKALYPAGQPRGGDLRRTPRQDAELVRTVRQHGPGKLWVPQSARAELHPKLVDQAVGYDAYQVRARIGTGYSTRWETFCDTVLFDADGIVVAAHRRRGRC